jgi:hypothetical protein
MARQPGLPGAGVDKQRPDFLVRRLQDLERDVRELRQALQRAPDAGEYVHTDCAAAGVR